MIVTTMNGIPGYTVDEVFGCADAIDRLACDRLDVDSGDAFFVGDGANDELAGAERVGMRSILIHRPGEEPAWPELRDWPGPQITSIPEVLGFL